MPSSESVKCGFLAEKKESPQQMAEFFNENVTVTVSPDRSRSGVFY